MPARQRRVGLQEIGLANAADPGVTRHLARFLRVQASGGGGSRPSAAEPSGLACPTHVLFNGGVMKAAALRARIVDVLSGWLTAEGFEPLDDRHVLDAPDPTTPSPRAPPTTASRGAVRASAFAAARPAATTSASKARCRPSPGFPHRSRPCASSRSEWKRAAARRSPVVSSASSSASRRSSVSELAREEERRAGHAHRGLGRRPRRVEPAGSDAAGGGRTTSAFP